MNERTAVNCGYLPFLRGGRGLLNKSLSHRLTHGIFSFVVDRERASHGKTSHSAHVSAVTT